MSDLSGDLQAEPSRESVLFPLPSGSAPPSRARDAAFQPAPPVPGVVEPHPAAGGVRPPPARAEAEASSGNGRNGRGGRRGGRGNGPGRGQPPAPRERTQPAPAAVAPSKAAFPRNAAAPRNPPEPSSPAPVAPTVCFTDDGTEWIARVAGFAASGRGRPGSGAPLVLVMFARAEDPDRPSLEVLHVGRGLESLDDAALKELRSRARPAPSASEREDIFSDTRARKRAER